MVCDRCNVLLAEYEQQVDVFVNEVLKTREAFRARREGDSQRSGPLAVKIARCVGCSVGALASGTQQPRRGSQTSSLSRPSLGHHVPSLPALFFLLAPAWRRRFPA